MLSWLNCYIDFNEIWHEDTLILDEGHRLIFTAITEINMGGAVDKTSTVYFLRAKNEKYKYC